MLIAECTVMVMGCKFSGTSVPVGLAPEINNSAARDGPNRFSIYASRATPTVQTTDLPGQWQYSRCLVCVYFRLHVMLLIFDH